MAGIRWHIGCSGFYYKEWKEVFYPRGIPQNRWFEYYCQHFNTLEINNTFYRFPELKTLQAWYNKSPMDFTFAVKAPQTITHQQKFTGSTDTIKDFYEVVQRGLMEKLGCILFQLPPQLQYSGEKLQTILQSLDPFIKNVIEFRHISWWRQEVMEALGDLNISFCGVSFPGLINKPIVNDPTVYYRFHGVPKLYHSSYKESFLEEITSQISHHPLTQAVYLFFNNTASAAALGNARYVQSLVKEMA
jgi:uncharacterized protein YecE (DUF72 family)